MMRVEEEEEEEEEEENMRWLTLAFAQPQDAKGRE